MENSDQHAATFLDSSRFWIQRVFVPILVCIGIVGNIVTVMVLTRRRMRCTTTIYLTALAVADLIYLIFVLVLSFEHYPNIHHRKFELYWRFYGITHWICDAASSTSVWLTVSFTIERYIVVCHPIKGKVLCTETRAKNIITLISILCLLTTLSTTFEHQLTFDEICKVSPNQTKSCSAIDKISSHAVPENLSVHNNSDTSGLPADAPSDFNLTNTIDNFSGLNSLSLTFDDTPVSDKEQNSLTNTASSNNNTKTMEAQNQTQPVLCENINGKLQTINGDNNATKGDCEVDCSLLNNTCCEVTYEISTEYTDLGKNKTYQTVFYWFSSIIFGLLPLVLIAMFNCFLVNAVYKSQTRRKRMTNSQESVTQNQENRITLLLIAVVVLFLLCQTPTASFLIYDALFVTEDTYTINIKRALGNIFNFLLNVNAACNFILYCVLSDRYRKTFKMLFCERRLKRQDTLAISRSRLSHRFNPHSNGFKRCKTEYGRTPRHLESIVAGAELDQYSTFEVTDESSTRQSKV